MATAASAATSALPVVHSDVRRFVRRRRLPATSPGCGMVKRAMQRRAAASHAGLSHPEGAAPVDGTAQPVCVVRGVSSAPVVSAIIGPSTTVTNSEDPEFSVVEAVALVDRMAMYSTGQVRISGLPPVPPVVADARADYPDNRPPAAVVAVAVDVRPVPARPSRNTSRLGDCSVYPRKTGAPVHERVAVEYPAGEDPDISVPMAVSSPVDGAWKSPVAGEVPAVVSAAVAVTKPAAVDLPVAVTWEEPVVVDAPAALAHAAPAAVGGTSSLRSLT